MRAERIFRLIKILMSDRWGLFNGARGTRGFYVYMYVRREDQSLLMHKAHEVGASGIKVEKK